MLKDRTHMPPAKRGENSAGWVVFVVDDDVDDLALTQRVLEKSPNIKEVVCASSAFELFGELHARHFFYDLPHNPPNSLILLDIHMPCTDGISLLEQLKSTPYTENIPVMIVSGDDQAKNIQDVHNLDASGFLTKPLNTENLHNIHEVIQKGRDWRSRGLERMA